MVFLQQDAFDDVDVSMSRERQLESFQLLKSIIEREYKFEDKDATRDFFTRLTGLYKNYNYSAPDSKEYKGYMKQIEELVAKYTRVA
jgi:V/A-type H+-transporting ATPase subunit A